MQSFFIAALLLTAVAARRGDDEHSGTQAPEAGEGGSVGDSDYPLWTDEMPPWFTNGPTKRPGNGNSQGPMKGTDGNNCQPSRPSQAPTQGTRQVSGVTTGDSHPEHRRHFGRPQRPPRGSWWPNRRNPGPMVFSPIFKADNVTFQNSTGVTLREGENIFLMQKHCGAGHHHHHHHHHMRRGRGRRHHMGGNHGPPENVQYVKLIYNATEPNEVSIEYGVLKHSHAPVTKGSFLMKLGAIVGVVDNPEEDY